MSHFKIVVISKSPEDVDRLMAPFDENIVMERYKDRIDVNDWWIKDKLVEEHGADPDDLASLMEVHNRRYEYEDDEGVQMDDEGLFEWTTYNPESKWDYWRIGGRWAGELLARPGATVLGPEPAWEWRKKDAPIHTLGEATLDEMEEEWPGHTHGSCDQAQKKDIDFDAMAGRKAEVQGDYFDKVKADPKGVDAIFSPKEIHDGTITREEFVAQNTAFSGHAVVTADGEWVERGRGGWWGAVHDEKDPEEWSKHFLAIVEAADPESWFTVIDIHI